MKILKTLFLSTLLVISTQALTMEEEMAQMQAEFSSYKMTQENEFDKYKKELDEEYKAYKGELGKFWKDPKLSSKKEWVSYSEDKKSRSEVDFEKNEIVIETIAPSKEIAQKQLQKRLNYAVSKSTEEVIKTDPLQKKVAEISKKIDKFKTKKDDKPILSNIVFDKKPTKKDVKKYVSKTLEKSKIEVKKSKLKDEKVYRIRVALPKNSTLKKSKAYEADVRKNAKRFEIPVPLIFAIIQTESDFNPFAKSHIPAFGLMQVVPTSAGRDIYKFLYKKKGMPSATYLYSGKNNIEMGSTYLHILYYRYLKKIKNPQSRLYCSIAAYNTGAGNIAWAFTRKYNVNKAVGKINAMTPEEVYNHLQANLRFDEPKHYLKRVRKRMPAYSAAYN
ncbi:DUF3393 domain-containing protein [Sulfurimonas aquatica]|uniref:DUF3393 domain-containing protein n=1 Tax=Sulfurimonas aquatica TaxID=2672570 RepID=A0A975B183_9BACT|nr:murein transglycosylase domain-containing protein [Sulfurimonas aquatica]QSZ42243.1 DUF3393 domain-containing protein [Sulfurimonas aquatica]